MIRIVLLVLGFILLLVQQYIIPIDLNTQFIVFLSGIVLLGIPHGAADLLIATKNADTRKRPFFKMEVPGSLFSQAVFICWHPLVFADSW